MARSGDAHAPFEFSTAAPQRAGRAFCSQPAGAVLVVDNGSWQCRAGWAGQAEPSVAFRSLLHRPRARSLPDGASVVGDYDVTLLRGVDPARCSVRSAFEANVVTTLEVQEAVLDHAFDRLALRRDGARDGGGLAHPLLLTQPLLAPPSTSARLAELCFEAYGVPALAFGADAAFAWAAATRSPLGALVKSAANSASNSGVVACCGHSATHALPVVAGQPLPAAAVRLSPGGLALSEHLGALLAARYPGLGGGVSARAEEVKHALCHVALSYADEARSYAALQRRAAQRHVSSAPDGDADDAHGSGGGRFAPGRLACVQLPWTPQAQPQQPQPPTAEELARTAERKKAAADRLRAMAAARRAAKADALAADVAAMEDALSLASAAAAAGDGDGDSAAEALATAGFGSEEELRAALGAACTRLRRLRGEGPEEAGEEAVPADLMEVDDSVKYPLLGVPDAELDADQLRLKRRQRLLKGGEEARARARLAKAAAAAAAEAEAAQLQQRFDAAPDAVLADLRLQLGAVERRVEARRQRRLGASAAAPALGESRRGGEAQRQRMRLMAAAAGAEPPPAGGRDAKRRRAGGAGAGGGEADDCFGADDADWDVYRLIDRDGSDSEAERADDVALAKLGARLSAFEGQRREDGFAEGPACAGGTASAAETDWNTAEAHQIWLGAERIRAPELLFQPTLAGIDQAGLAEAIAIALQRAPADARASLRVGPLLLTGGGAALHGLAARLQQEVVMTCEPGRAMPVVLSSETPWLDAWRGASLLAADALASPAATTAAEWAESGASGLRRKPQLRYA